MLNECGLSTKVRHHIEEIYQGDMHTYTKHTHNKERERERERQAQFEYWRVEQVEKKERLKKVMI